MYLFTTFNYDFHRVVGGTEPTYSILNLDVNVERLECNMSLRRGLIVWTCGRGIPRTGLSAEPEQKLHWADSFQGKLTNHK